MIEISWLWLPLIVTLLLGFLCRIFEEVKEVKELNLFIYLFGISFIMSLLIYICYGIYWIATHVKFV